MARRPTKASPPAAPASPVAGGVGDPLDREIDAAIREGRAIHGMSPAARSAAKGLGRSTAAMTQRIHPETGEPIGVGDGDDTPAPRPSAGFPHAHAEANAAVPQMPATTDGPQDRVRAIRQRHPEYSEEYELRLYGRMHMRNMGMDVIAASLGVSLRTAYNKRAKWQAACAAQAANFDMNGFVGEGLSFYLDVRGGLMRLADKADAKDHTRISAYQAAASVQNSMAQFVAAMGVVAQRPFRPAAEKDGRYVEGEDIVFQLERALLRGPEDLAVLFEDKSKPETPAEDIDTSVRVY